MYTQSCLTLRNPMDGSPPGSLAMARIFQARILESVPVPTPGINPRFWRLLHWQVDSLP